MEANYLCVFTAHMVYFFNSRVPVKCGKIARDLGVGACEKPSGVKGLIMLIKCNDITSHQSPKTLIFTAK